ncbi:hypothetical protein Tco_1251559 [Tanacetum coccineum]
MTQKTPSPTLQLSSPSAPNAPSKTPSTKDTSSSLIDYIPKSSTSSTLLSPNGYLNPLTSLPPRVSPPLPTQENASMDITLTLSPITLLDVQIKQKSQENEQNRTKTNTGTEEHAKSREKAIKSNTSSNAPYWPIPTRNATLDDEEAQGMMGFVLIVLTKEAHKLSHHGWPRWQSV